MPVTTNLGLAVSSDQRDYVLEYWMKMLNESNGNFVLLDNEFGVLASKLSFNIYPETWVAEDHAPFYYKSTVTLNAVVQDNSIVEAYFEDILVSTGVILHSMTQNGTQVELVFYADSAKQSTVSGFVKYVYSVPGADPLPTPSANVEPKTITANGVYDAHAINKDGYNPVTVSVAANVIPLSASANGTYSKPEGADGYAPVVVNVPDSGEALVTGVFPESKFSLTGNTKTLRNCAFLYCTNLKEVILNPNITYINNSCFQNCFNLTSVNGLDNVLVLGISAFTSCWSLTTINSLSKCLSVGMAAFDHCSSLAAVSLPNCNYIGGGVFQYALSLTSVFAPEAFLLDNMCFQSCTKLKLESDSFSKILILSSNAFNGCSLISNINCFSNLLILYSGAFQGCKSITSANFPNLVSLVGDPFTYNQGQLLTYFSAPLISRVAYGQFSKFSSTLSFINLQYLQSVESSAFMNCSLISSFEFSRGLDGIETNAFMNCYGLSQIKITGFNYRIAASAFANCSLLESVYIYDGSSTSIRPLANSNVFAGTPLANETLLGRFGSIYVPASKVASYKTATNWAFYSDRIAAFDSSIESTNVFTSEYMSASLSENPKPSAVYIGQSAFYSLKGSNLSWSFPECKIIDRYAFGGASIVSIDLPNAEFLDVGVFAQCSLLKTANIPNVFFLNSAFYGCRQLEAVNAPELEILKGPVFDVCSRLSAVSFPKLKYAIEASFGNCYSLVTAYLPELTITLYEQNSNMVRDRFFYNCSSLTTAYLPKLQIIGQSMFDNCRNLVKTSFNEVKEIRNDAFINCSSLSKVCFPKCLNFNNSAFYNCFALQSLYLGDYATIKWGSEPTILATDIFSPAYLQNLSVYVRASLLSKYQTALGWSSIFSQFVGLTDSEFQDIIDHWDDE